MNRRGRSALCALALVAVACAPEEPLATPPPRSPVAVAPPAPAVAAPTASPDAGPPQRFDVDLIDRYLAREVTKHGLVGLSVAIARGGKIELAKGYGKASLATGAPVTVDTAFGIGSVTKQITCAALLTLADDGKLDVRDKVAKYEPGLTRAKDVSLYDLVTHASGYPDYYPLDFVDREMSEPIEPAALVERYGNKPLDFEPGTRWSYSNTGFVIAGRVIEKVAKEPLASFFARRIFTPLGMAHASFAPRPGSTGLAEGHASFALGPPEPVAPEASGWLDAAGGIAASALDLAKWDLAIAQGKVLKPKSARLMTTPRVLADGSSTGYACGVNVSARRGEVMLGHSGSISGFHAFNVIIPRTGSAVVVLSNSEADRAAAVYDALVSLILKGKRPGLAAAAVAGSSPEVAAAEVLAQLRAGTIDRSKLGADFAHYLTDARVAAVAARLAALGAVVKIELQDVGERGGMEVAALKLTFQRGAARTNLYRTPDGKVQQLLLD